MYQNFFADGEFITLSTECSRNFVLNRGKNLQISSYLEIWFLGMWTLGVGALVKF